MKYRYSFEEKKKRAGIIAACVFVVLAGIVYLYNRHSDPEGVHSLSVDESADPGQMAEDNMSDSGGYNTSNNYNESGGHNESTGKNGIASGITEEPATIKVHVCGAVTSPGVYELGSGARVSDAIDAAGGFGKKAAKDYLNLAAGIEDGEKIYVPTKKELKSSDGTGADTSNISNSPNNSVPTLSSIDVNSTTDSNNRTDSNTASEKININTATREELMTLPGIGESKADDIISYREENGRFSSIEDIMNIRGIKEGLFSKIADRIITD